MQILRKHHPAIGSRPPVRWLEHLRAVLIREGPLGLLTIIGQRLLSALFETRVVTVFRRPLDEPALDYPPKIPVTVREMTVEDLERFRHPPAYLREHRLEEFAERLKTGRVGVIALSGDQVAGYAWLSLKNEIERWTNLEISLQQGEGYLFDLFIFPVFRGHGVYPTLQNYRFECLKGRGCRVAYGVVVARNFPALKWYERFGFTAVRQIGHIRILGLKWRISRSVANSSDGLSFSGSRGSFRPVKSAQNKG
jgi:GNAT superfamily N-acetyltransferase